MQDTALLIIDFQNDYFSTFKEAKFPLHGTEEAALNTAKILQTFRAKKLPIIHVQHENLSDSAAFFQANTQGVKIHKSVEPLENEPIVVKRHINAFKQTQLQSLLESLQIKRLIIAGAMSHMCIDAAVRAASDLEFECCVVDNGCATKDLEFNGTIIKAEQVHKAFMSALQFAYAKIVSTNEVLQQYATE